MNDSKIKLLPALAALGGSLAAGQAQALEIGRINVQSTLGEPLRASIAYALGPNEQLSEYCVALRPSAPGFAIPSISRATINVDRGLITITGSTALREPLAMLRLDITCPYTPRISREYMLMIDPGSRALPVDAATAPTAAITAEVAGSGSREAARPAARTPAAAARDRASALTPLEPLATGDRVFVEVGETLSRIVAAVGGRSVDDAEAARRFVDANRAAFVDGDPDRLEAGSWLTIPDLAAATPAASFTRATEPVATPTEAASRPATNAYASTRQEPPAAQEPAPATQRAVEATPYEEAQPAPPPAESLATSAPNAGIIDDTDFLEPAPISSVADADAANPPGSADTRDAGPVANAGVPASALPAEAQRPRDASGAEPAVAPAARPVRREREAASGIPTFWFWLIGGGTTVIAGLLALLFQSRRTAQPARADRAEHRPNPLLERVKQSEGIEVEPIHAFTTPDFDLGDDSPTAENPVLNVGRAAAAGFDDDGALAADQHTHRNVDINLDAVRYEDSDTDADSIAAGRDGDDVDVDLSSGSGFDQGEHTRIDENFSFAATTALDFELPEERAEAQPQPQTDIIPPLNIEESSILKSEVLPDEDDDDYDMSMILDATKQPDPSEVTEKDLHAVVVDAGDNTVNAGDYTIARDPEFELLEQDYEDELTATQALNMEIERAALELAGRIDAEDDAAADATMSGPAITDFETYDDEAPTAVASLYDEPDDELTQELPTDVAPLDRDAATAIAAFDEYDDQPTDIASLDDDAPTAIASLDDDEPPTRVALLDDETIDAALAAADDEEPTAIAPLDDADDPTAVAPLDGEEDDTPFDDFPTDVAALEQTSIESQLAHLPGEMSAEAANDDPLFDENDATGINAALVDGIGDEDGTVEMAHDDEEPTIRLSRDDDDDTVEMPPRSRNA